MDPNGTTSKGRPPECTNNKVVLPTAATRGYSVGVSMRPAPGSRPRPGHAQATSWCRCKGLPPQAAAQAARYARDGSAAAPPNWCRERAGQRSWIALRNRAGIAQVQRQAIRILFVPERSIAGGHVPASTPATTVRANAKASSGSNAGLARTEGVAGMGVGVARGVSGGPSLLLIVVLHVLDSLAFALSHAE